jgi:hypothetical protein
MDEKMDSCNPKEKQMKKMLLAVLLLGMVLIQGCSTWGNGKIDLPVDAYQAGRTFVFVDTITQPYQPSEMKAAIHQIYAIASVNIEADVLLDEVVKQEIAKMYPDTSKEGKEMIFNVYKAMFHRIVFQIEKNPNIPKAKVLEEFFKGVRDALEVYQPKAV